MIKIFEEFPLPIFMARHPLTLDQVSNHCGLKPNEYRAAYYYPDANMPVSCLAPEQVTICVDKFVAACTDQDIDPARVLVLSSPYARAAILAKAAAQTCETQVVYKQALREIGFGLFDGIARDTYTKLFPHETAYRAKHFDKSGADYYATMPMGDSYANVADRMESLFENLFCAIDLDNYDAIFMAMHGGSMRAGAAVWQSDYPQHEFFKTLKNPDNCAIWQFTPDQQSHRVIYAGIPVPDELPGEDMTAFRKLAAALPARATSDQPVP